MTPTILWRRRQLIECISELHRIRGTERKRGGLNDHHSVDADIIERQRARVNLRARLPFLERRLREEIIAERRRGMIRSALPDNFAEQDRMDEFWETFGKSRPSAQVFQHFLPYNLAAHLREPQQSRRPQVSEVRSRSVVRIRPY